MYFSKDSVVLFYNRTSYLWPYAFNIRIVYILHSCLFYGGFITRFHSKELIISLAVNSKGPTPSVPKPTIGCDPEIVTSISYPYNLIAYVRSILMASFHLLLALPNGCFPTDICMNPLPSDSRNKGWRKWKIINTHFTNFC
jgi:hypothetical protein